jgi:hypothetical protein
MAKGKKTGGRQKGTPNKLTKTIREAVLLAASNVGSDGQGDGGLVGYLTMVATTAPQCFVPLLGRCIPLEVTGEGGGPVSIRVVTGVPASPEQGA